MREVHELLQSLFAAVYLLWSSPDGGKAGKLYTFDNREQVVEDAHTTPRPYFFLHYLVLSPPPGRIR